MNYHRMYSEKQKKDINLTQDMIFFFTIHFILYNFVSLFCY